jgi:MFS family permease
LKAGFLHLFHSFRYRNYLWLWFIVALTNTGNWTVILAVTWQVYNMTGSSFWSGAIMFASMFPNIIGAPIVGVLADKIERRSLIFAAIGLAFIVLTIFTVLTVLHMLTAITMVILALLFGLGISTLNVSINAIVPTLIPKEALYNAYSLQAVGQRGTEFIGPIIATPILAMFGVQSVYLLGAAVFAVSVLFALLLSVPRLEHHQLKSNDGFFPSFIAGFTYIRNHRSIMEIVVLVGLHCSLTMSFLGMLPGFVKSNLGANSSFYGILMSMVGLGAIVATLLMAGVKNHHVKMKLFWISGLLSGLSLAFLGVSKNNTVAIVAILIVGSSQALFMTLTIAFIQELTEEHVRGRVTSVYFVLAAGLMSVANWGYGWLSSLLNPQYIMLVTGILFTIVIVGYRVLKIKNAAKLQSEETVGM